MKDLAFDDDRTIRLPDLPLDNLAASLQRIRSHGIATAGGGCRPAFLNRLALNGAIGCACLGRNSPAFRTPFVVRRLLNYCFGRGTRAVGSSRRCFPALRGNIVVEAIVDLLCRRL